MPSLSHDAIPDGGSVEWALFTTVQDFSRDVDDFVQRTSKAPFIGVDIHLCVDGSMDAIALAANDYAVVIVVTNSTASNPAKRTRRRGQAQQQLNGPLSRLFGGEFGRLAGFGMARLAAHSRFAFGVHMKGFDISSSIPAKKSLSPGQLLRDFVYHAADSHALDTLWDTGPQELENDPERFSSLILRAWLASKISEGQKGHIASGGELDTGRLRDKHFQCLYKMLVEEERIDAIKPRQVEGEFSDVTHTKKGDMVITNERYKTRVRASDTTKIVMQDEHKNEFVGRAIGANGKRTSIKTLGNAGRAKITKVKVVGKEERTVAEKACDTYLLLLLRGKRDLNDPGFPLIKHLWFPDKTTQASVQKQGSSEQTTFTGERLNESQAAVVDAMVNSSSKFVTVHGPPGTGKTSTISAAVKQWVQSSSSAWLVAQSNVGVKNIAERLCKENIPFRIIVSKDFYFEWHEHIYEERIKKQLVRVDELPKHPPDVERLFHGVRVVLCTLSTLSNPALTDKKIFFHVPLVNLVVDEASQIGIFNYLHLFGQFKNLAKVCFFGDPKQLPPYGQEAAVTMESIFDVQHLKPHAYFLDTQYRMPDPLGNFISGAVYNSKLKSSHSIKNPSCVAFVDRFGEEERKGASYMNRKEAQSVVHLVKSYYTNKNYCIITPYDGQRGHLQDELKRAGLRWDNVFNVDSFQGNEADYILISVVRSGGPGFLKSKQRVNVMLTRCRKGMVIVSNRAFMHRANVQKTILGKLCRHWESKYGKGETWRSWQEVADRRAILPGVGAASSSDEIVVETRPEVKPPQLTPSAKSLLSKELNENASSSTQKGANRQAQPSGGIALTSKVPSPTSTTSSSSVTASKAQPPHNPSTESGKKVNVKRANKATLKPSVKVDESDPLPDQFQNINLNTPMIPKSKKASKKAKKAKK